MENELENGEHDTEHSTDEQFDNLDNIILITMDRTEGERFYFVGASYNSKLDFIDSLMPFILWDWATSC